MSWIIVILAGAFIGWIASMIMGTDAQMRALANIVAAVVGAAGGRSVSNSVFQEAYGTDVSGGGILFGVIGACILIGIVKALSGSSRPIVH